MVGYFIFALVIIIPFLALLSYFLKKKGYSKNSLFFAGIAYIASGLPLLFSWFLIFGLILIAFGGLLIFLSRYRLALAWQIFIILTLPIASLALWFHSESSRNIFLIPENYRGRVLIVHGCQDGSPREFEGRYRIYRIQANGILKSKFDFAGSSFDHLHSRFFYVKQDTGERLPILEQSDDGKTDDLQIQGLWSLQLQSNGETPIDFIVDKKGQDLQDYQKERFDEFQKAMDDCSTQ